MIAVATAAALASANVTLWTVLLVHARRHTQTVAALLTWPQAKRAYFAYQRGLISYEDYLDLWRADFDRRRVPLNARVEINTSHMAAYDRDGREVFRHDFPSGRMTVERLSGVARGGEGQGGLAVD